MFWNAVGLGLIALLIVGIGFVVGGWLASAASMRLDRTGMDPLARRVIASVVKPIVVIVAIVAAMNVIGVDLTSVVAILGAATLAVGLALKESLSNIAAGLLLLTLRPFAPGDSVDAGGESGVLVDLRLMTTHLKTPQGVHVTVPNTAVLQGAVRNYTANGLRRVDVDVEVEGGSNASAAVDVASQAVAAVEGVLSDPAPSVSAIALGAQGVTLRIAAWVPVDRFGPLRTAIVLAVDQAFQERDIKRASPLSALLTRP